MARTSLMETRLLEKIEQRRQELRDLEEEAKRAQESVRFKKTEIAELEYIRGGSSNGTRELIERVQKPKRKYTKRNGNGNGSEKNRADNFITAWSDEEDNLVIQHFKNANAPLSAPQAARELHSGELSARSVGAIRLRINAMAKAGRLKWMKHQGKKRGIRSARMLEAA